jgi:aryl-alcohol dehydrogenase-like predicted oxidoreductase
MEYRSLGHSGLKVPVLSFGTATFGGRGEFFKMWGNTDVNEATRLIHMVFQKKLLEKQLKVSESVVDFN